MMESARAGLSCIAAVDVAVVGVLVIVVGIVVADLVLSRLRKR